MNRLDLDALSRGAEMSPLDIRMAQALAGITGEESTEVALAAALVSAFTRRGHICADLKTVAGTRLPSDVEPAREYVWPELGSWLDALRHSALVATSGEWRPLVLDGRGRLYLYRYWDYERRLGDQLARRASHASGEERLRVITGGPGTGKTFAVARIMCDFVEEALDRDESPPRIMLMAPTGKAAARLKESVETALAAGGQPTLEFREEVLGLIPREASTIHRALGWLPGDPTRFRHNPGDPLPADLVVVDEASMVDLALMTKLAEAVPSEATLVLLGDKDQLASVEAGAVLGDICNVGGTTESSRPPISGCLVHLTESFRFPSTSGIGRLAGSINSADGDAVIDVLEGDEFPDVCLVDPGSGGVGSKAVKAAISKAYGEYFSAESPLDRLEHLRRSRILCAHRRGPLGLEEVNARVESIFHRQRGVGWTGEWYDGRPVMVTRNDHELELYNGDVGVVSQPDDKEMVVLFEDPGGDGRRMAPSRLPSCETVFATSVHKAQGSEFDNVFVILPPVSSPVITRELLYTAVTRARRSLTIVGRPPVVREAVSRNVQRFSGLRERLWGDSGATAQ